MESARARKIAVAWECVDFRVNPVRPRHRLLERERAGSQVQIAVLWVPVAGVAYAQDGIPPIARELPRNLAGVRHIVWRAAHVAGNGRVDSVDFRAYDFREIHQRAGNGAHCGFGNLPVELGISRQMFFELFAREVVAGIALYLRKMQRAQAAVSAAERAEIVVDHHGRGFEGCGAAHAFAQILYEVFVERADDVFHPRFAPVVARDHLLEGVRNFELKAVPESSLQNYARLAIGSAQGVAQAAVLVLVEGDFVEGRVPLRHEKKGNHVDVRRPFPRHLRHVGGLLPYLSVEEHRHVEYLHPAARAFGARGLRRKRHAKNSPKRA